MQVKQWKKLAAILLLMLCVFSAASADSAGINVMGVYPLTDQPVMYFEVRTLDSAGRGVQTQAQDIHFTAGEENVELSAKTMPDGNVGHIIVVDTSLYYFGTKYIKIENIRDIISFYLSKVNSNDRVMFILANDAQPVITNYMSLIDARNYVESILLGTQSSAKISSAIYTAFQYAGTPSAGNPAFNSVFIVADPDLDSNEDNERSLNECIQARAQSGRNFDVVVALPYRQSYLEGTNEKRRTALQEGFAEFSAFTSQVSGQMVQLLQKGNDHDNSIDVSNLRTVLGDRMNTSNYFAVDFSALSGKLEDSEEAIRTIPVSVIYDGRAKMVNVQLDTNLLPEPVATPTPTPDPKPTPTPEPTPVIFVGQTDSKAMQAIHALYKLNYLDKTNFSEFNNECFIAYIEFCEKNGINPRDGIYEETYNLLISDRAIGIAAATPVPTPTPEPTIPPNGYSINDVDTDGSGSFIAQIQAILKNLNCYKDGAYATAGRMDQATIDAINVYCAAFNWRNDRVDGVSKNICQDILNYGPERVAVVEINTPTPAPTIPPEGFGINDFDTEENGAFIAQIQAILKNLNCYKNGAYANVGRMDQATVDAINVYCEAYNWRNDRIDGVSRSICQDILMYGSQRVPVADPEPTTKEKMMAFFQREIVIAGFGLKMWIPAVVCVVLLFLIVVLIILFSGGKGKDKKKEHFEESDSGLGLGEIRNVSVVGFNEPNNALQNPGGEDEGTIMGNFSKPVTLRIEYKGQVQKKDVDLAEREPFVIGRNQDCDYVLAMDDKEASRKHAMLIFRDDLVYLRDVSTYHSTRVNGVKLRTNGGTSEDTLVASGDVITAGGHKITVMW